MTESYAQGVCQICSDRATGKHYGAISCDGCKDHRNSCRSCRLQKCIEAGMRAEAIQNKRDIIGRRRKNESDEENTILQVLLRSEIHCQQLRGSVIYDTSLHRSASYRPTSEQQAGLVTLDDIGKSIHQQLLLLVEWAKTLPQFVSLTLEDQVSLLKANAAQLIVLGVAYRSMFIDDAICLANDTFITKRHATPIGDINSVVGRIIEEIISPMRQLHVDKNEYVALKAILFFNPVCSEVRAKRVVGEARLDSVRILQSRCEDEECRASLLLLLLPQIHSIAQQLIENVDLASTFRLINVDALMQELILQNQPSTIIQQLMSPSPHQNG